MSSDERQSQPQTTNLLGELTFSVVVETEAMLTMRSLVWHSKIGAARAGIPFLVAHDLGLLFHRGMSGAIQIGVRRRSLAIAKERLPHQDHEAIAATIGDYQQLLKVISKTPLCEFLQRQNVNDSLIAALLVHVLDGIQFNWPFARQSLEGIPPASTFDNQEPAHHLTPQLAQELLVALKHLVRQQTQVLVAVEQVDLDSLRLLEMAQGDGAAGAFFLDWYQMLNMPMAQDIAKFSLDLLPSVLESKNIKGAQRHSLDGFASIENRGSLEALLPSELVYENEIFDRRYLNKEQLYYAREKEEENKERRHCFLVDASASMRGIRTVFARGVALAMAKKALLMGEKVIWRFFDSRLHEKQMLKNTNMRVPYLLCFKGERGRNTTQVFTDLHRELARLGQRPSQELVVTFFSHSRCLIRPEVIHGLKKQARLYGVFVVPGNEEIHLDYLGRLDGHHIVSSEVLEDRAQRQDHALALLKAHQADVSNIAAA